MLFLLCQHSIFTTLSLAILNDYLIFIPLGLPSPTPDFISMPLLNFHLNLLSFMLFIIFFTFSFFKFILFILRERERASTHMGGAEREGEKENPKQALHCQLEPKAGLEFTKHVIMT